MRRARWWRALTKVSPGHLKRDPWIVTSICVFLALGGAVVWAGRAHASSSRQEIFDGLVGIGALVAAVLVGRATLGMMPRYRRAWLFIAGALLVAGGIHGALVVALQAHNTSLSNAAEVGSLLAAILAVPGVLGLTTWTKTTGRVITLILDAVISGLSLLVVAWVILLPEISVHHSTYGIITRAVVGAVLSALVLLWLSRVPRRCVGPMVMMLLAGTSAVAGSVLAPVLGYESTDASTASVLLYTAAFGLVALAPLAASWNSEVRATDVFIVQQVLPYLMAFVAVATVAVAHMMGRDVEQPGYGMVAMVAVALVARQLVSALDERTHLSQLVFEATHDSLTGLSNRNALLQRLESVLQRPPDRSRSHALLMIDLDEFKSVNDGLSHAIGDSLLKSIATRLRRVVRPTDLIARLGGDEFAILLENARPSDAHSVCRRIRKSMQRPFGIEDQLLRQTCSIGIALAGAGETPSALLRKADAAMYATKREGKDGWLIFDEGMEEAAIARLRLIQDAGQAIVAGDLKLVYQPIVHLESGELLAVEALLRWKRPGQGWISAGEAVEALEGSRLMRSLDDWVTREACQQVAQWREEGWAMRVGINVSAAELADSSFPKRVASLLREGGVQPWWIVIEVTETSAQIWTASARKILRTLRAMGIRISIDDFGTGYSAVKRISDYNLDSIKIDRSFISECTSVKGRNLVKAMVGMGRSVNLTVIAEGIETLEQARLLGNMGCDYGQGYFFSPPLPAIELYRKYRSTPLAVLRGTSASKGPRQGPSLTVLSSDLA